MSAVTEGVLCGIIFGGVVGFVVGLMYSQFMEELRKS